MNGQSVPHDHPANHCRAVVQVDGTRIRKKTKNDYEKALRHLAHSRRQLDQFHQTDLPQYTRWLSAHFGASLTERRSAGEQRRVGTAPDRSRSAERHGKYELKATTGMKFRASRNCLLSAQRGR